MQRLTLALLFALLISCNISEDSESNTYPTIGSLEKIADELDTIIHPEAKAEIIAQGFDWSEGPVWVASHQMLLFSDVPKNTIYKWTEGDGLSTYLSPSGYTGEPERGGEMGSNGLVLDAEDRLVMCQHGNRQMARMDAPLDAPEAVFTALADNYQGQRFNSPNDAVYDKKGRLFFTDPPYGLVQQMDDPQKEIPYQGVYMLNDSGGVVLVTDQLTRPNGINLLPGEKTLLVANSDPSAPNWYAIDLLDNNQFSEPRIFYSAAGYDRKLKGLPDGLKLDANGTIFATGPGGLWIFNASGKLLGKYHLADGTSNCALSADEKTLYLTNDDKLLRLKLR